MSDLPGAPRRDIDPAVIRDQLEELTAQVARLMESQETRKPSQVLSYFEIGPDDCVVRGE